MNVESEGDRAVSTTRSRLVEIGYLNPDKVLEDAINLLTRYNSLELLSSTIERKGTTDELIKLSGRFSVTPPTDLLEIFGTITIWVEKTFPNEAPHLSFTQTNIPSSYFEPFLNTKQGTVLFSPYYKWNERESTLLELVQCVALNLRQVCLGWVLSARDQEESNYVIPPRLSLPTGFPPVPIAPNKPFDPTQMSAMPPYMNTITPNSIQPPHQGFPRPRPGQPLLPNPAQPFPFSNVQPQYRLPHPNMPYYPQAMRQTSTPHQDPRSSYVSVVGPTSFMAPQPLVTPSQPPPLQAQISPSLGPRLHTPEIASSPPKTHKTTEAQNGIFPVSPSSPSQTNQNSDISSPAVPMSARKVKNM